MIDDNRILIVGAGPVGLSLACLLAAAHTPFRLIDAKEGIGKESRALGIHARTLEVMQSLGLAEAFVTAGRATRYMTFHDKNASLFSLDFEALSKDTRFAYYLIVPQCETEAILYKKLLELGGDVEWSTPLRSVEDSAENVNVHFENDSVRYPFVVGCDGAASLVRKSLGIAFSGNTYDARFLLSEVRIADDRLPTDATHVIMTPESVLAAIPLPDGSYRLVGPDSLAPKDAESGAAITFDAFRKYLGRNGLLRDAEFHDPSRVVSYRMQKRVADAFMGKRTFLAGDAAHIHSPAGGQGMNMGIQDSANLAWKLTIAFRYPNDPLLGSYDTERRKIACAVAAGTDKALRMMSAPGFGLRLALRTLVPAVLRVWQPRKFIHAMAQLAIRYGPEEQGITGARLPYISLAAGGDVFDLLKPGRPLLLHIEDITLNDFERLRGISQVHLLDNHYFRKALKKAQTMQQHSLVSSELEKLSGAKRILVRPDGYIAAIDQTSGAQNVTAQLAKWGLTHV